MLAPSEVLNKARTYLGEVVPEFAVLDPKVEEMVLASDSSQWRITFYAHSRESTTMASVADLISRKRIEKEVLVSPTDGTLIAVKNPVPF